MKKQDRYYFPAVFTYADDHEIAITFPDLDVATSGSDDRDAFLSARECLGISILGLEEDSEQIPHPSRLSDIPLQDNEVVVLIDVFMPTIRMANQNRSVNRTVTLPAWLNAIALENNVNFSQLLQDAIRRQLSL